ncbi:MAG: hypothetical protein JWO10_1393 [Microbacteriaceae bacterium]|nr:hypothetical protein [Microbacteriaceae bacterium]
MVEGAVQLLATNGLEGTSFSELLELTGAPRGSVYHHFPQGKNQLLSSAVTFAGDRALALLDQWVGATPEEITERFLAIWKTILTRSGFAAGCAIVAVTVSTDSPALLDQTAGVFRSWRARIAELFEQGGAEPRAAARFAATLVAASEGAVVISRAEQSMEPFDLVSEQLIEQVRQLLPAA